MNIEELKELFKRPYEVRAEFQDLITVHFLREPTRDEDLAYRRRSATVKIVSGRVETTDAAQQAAVLLYDSVCQRVAVENGDRQDDVEGLKQIIPDALKNAVISVWEGRHRVMLGEPKSVKSLAANNGE